MYERKLSVVSGPDILPYENHPRQKGYSPQILEEGMPETPKSVYFTLKLKVEV